MDVVHDEPFNVAAENGQVLMDGPGGVALAFTPDAAIETSDRLLAAAAVAAGQKPPPADRPDTLQRPT